jgi:hypothetical protein
MKKKIFIFLVVIVLIIIANADKENKIKSEAQSRPVVVSGDVSVNEEWGNLRKVNIEGFSGNAQEPFISRDSEYLFFNDFKPNDAKNHKKMHWATRIDDVNFQYQGLLEGVNGSGAVDGAPSMDENNNFYWISTRSYFEDFITVYKGKFTGNEVVGIEKVTGNYQVKKPGDLHFDVEVSKDGEELYVVNSVMKDDAPVEANFMLASSNGAKLTQSTISSLNTNSLEYAASISSDELEVYFTRVAEVSIDADFGIFVVKRDSINEPFGQPERITSVGSGFLEAPAINDLGNLLYFHKLDRNKFSIYVVER